MRGLRRKFGSAAALLVLLFTLSAAVGASQESWRRAEDSRPERVEPLAEKPAKSGRDNISIPDLNDQQFVIILGTGDAPDQEFGDPDPDVVAAARSAVRLTALEDNTVFVVSETNVEGSMWSFAASTCSVEDNCLAVLAGEESITFLSYLLARWQWLLVGPLVLALGAYLAARSVVRQSLLPIENMRQELAAITSATLGNRVTVTKTGDEVETLGKTLNETIDRLENAVLANERLVADAAHELRSPLTAVRAALEVENLREPRSLLDESVVELDRAGHLIDDLLLLARSPSTESRMELVDVDDLVLGEVRALRAKHPEVEISQKVTPTQQRMAHDAIRRVIQNLLENAVKYGGGQVAIELSQKKSQTVLTVDDNGAGIAPEDHATIFDRFSRLDSSRARTTGGAGLGLAIVQETVEAHRGTIAVDTSPLGGSRFVVSIPSNDKAEHKGSTQRGKAGRLSIRAGGGRFRSSPNAKADDTTPLLAISSSPGEDDDPGQLSSEDDLGSIPSVAQLTPRPPKKKIGRRIALLSACSIAVAVPVGAYALFPEQTRDILGQGSELVSEGLPADGPDSDGPDSDGPDSDDETATENENAEDTTSTEEGPDPAAPETSGTEARTVALNRLNWKITASHLRDNELPVSTMDGRMATRWTTGVFQESGMWLQIDLGSSKEFSSIELLLAEDSRDDSPRGYALFVSDDPTEFGKPIISTEPKRGSLEIDFARQNGRYIRIELTRNAAKNWWSVSEVFVYK